LIDSNDFLSSLIFRNLDFLCVVFGVFPAKLMMTDEELISAREKEIAIRREREAAIQCINDAKLHLTEKTSFKRGVWNVKTIGDDGLGSSSLRNLVVPPPEDDEIRRRSAVVAPVMGLQSVADLDTLHEKLSELWIKLQLSPIDRMALMTKYSSKEFIESIINAFASNKTFEGPLYEILYLWEGVVSAILKREDCLARMEEFERVSSDPARYFMKVVSLYISNCNISSRSNSHS
jgi:hypothetical protein